MNKFNLKPQDLAYDRLAHRFDELMNEYDLNRRLEILIDEFLQNINLTNKLILDAGCGTGRSSLQLRQRGAQVIALDVGFNLVRHTKTRCNCHASAGNILALPFPNNAFDIVFSSEVIEHTSSPLDAVLEMYRVLKPGGHLVLSTPNWLWQLPVRIASSIRLRPYEGFENFVKPVHLRNQLKQAGSQIVTHKGIHLLPFQFNFIHPVLRIMDKYGQYLLPLMINQCIHCIKPVES